MKKTKTIRADVVIYSNDRAIAAISKARLNADRNQLKVSGQIYFTDSCGVPDVLSKRSDFAVKSSKRHNRKNLMLNSAHFSIDLTKCELVFIKSI